MEFGLPFFFDRAKADRVRQRLVQTGIPAETKHEPPLGRLWFVPKRVGGLRVEVKAEDFGRASEWLREWDESEGLAQEAIRCPDCGSLRVDYPQFTQKSILTNLGMGLMAELGLVPKEYYCEDCHYTWPKEGSRLSVDRPHMAPYYFIEGVERKALSARR